MVLGAIDDLGCEIKKAYQMTGFFSSPASLETGFKLL